MLPEQQFAFHPGPCSILWLPKWSADRLTQINVPLSSLYDIWKSCFSPARKGFLQQFRIKHFEKQTNSLFFTLTSSWYRIYYPPSLYWPWCCSILNLFWVTTDEPDMGKKLLKERLKAKWYSSKWRTKVIQPEAAKQQIHVASYRKQVVEQADWKSGNNYYWLETTWTKRCSIK